ncbi:response regulator [Pseudooceanicola sp. 216_PA32_1]|uniref:Response regulator n=1 Tax=Pseudooceanicola pacificus TaxID=2676438 RepID=A0A844WEQ0_9RHOB|nr:response regulator [Pseudooceanicola pacificus]MWB77579.1 response regulator [Pseudooceanicola pacificus]
MISPPLPHPAFATAYLVDDEALDRRMYERLLTRHELCRQVSSHATAEPLLALFTRAETAPGPDDAIFLDVNLPGMSGIEFLETCATLRPAAPPPVFLMLTQALTDRDRRRAEITGLVRASLDKPLTRTGLMRLTSDLAGGMPCHLAS